MIYHRKYTAVYDKYKTWSLSFDTWVVCVFCLHVGLTATAAHPICAEKHRLAMYQKAVAMFYLLTYYCYRVPVIQFETAITPDSHPDFPVFPPTRIDGISVWQCVTCMTNPV